MVNKIQYLVLGFLIFLLFNLSAQESDKLLAEYELSFLGYNKFVLTEEKALFENIAGVGGLPEKLEVADYSIRAISKIPFLFNAEGKRILLILRNEEICYLFGRISKAGYPSRDMNIFAGIASSYFRIKGLTEPLAIKASSFLTDPKKAYRPENIGEFYLDAPWVEGGKGQGIGEKIRFSTNTLPTRYGTVSGFYIFNGFVSFDKPELYLKNSRVKILKVIDVKSGVSRNVTLQDTPEPQYIDTREFQGTEIELEILEVYPGSAYEDTCIAGIVLKRF